MSQGFTPYYSFIRVESTRREKIPDGLFMSRTKLKNIYLFELQLSTISEIHVSTGMKELKENGLPEIIMLQYANNKDGKPSIPGSSLKGVISTNYLALAGSSALTSELFGSDRHPAISKVFFEDIVPLEPIEMKLVKVNRAWEPRRRGQSSVKIYTSKAPPTEHSGYLQCIPSGTVFSTTIRGVGLKDFEVGGLLMSLGLNIKNNEVTTGVIKMGYGKPQGFGQLKLEPENSKLISVEFDGLTKNLKPQGTLGSSSTIKKYIDAFTNEIRKNDPKRNLDQNFKIIFRGI